jgi:prepilin-type N-terminal cleavage/methylation domain-containing protein
VKYPQPIHQSSRTGFTLVESLIAVSLLAVLFLAVLQTSSRASDAFDEGSVEHELWTSTQRALERIGTETELGDAGLLAGAVTSEYGSSALEFRVPTGFAGGAVQWSGTIRIALELEPGELDDGLDNDGDGFIDEGRVVRTNDLGTAEEQRLVLLNGVAELQDGESANGLDDNGNLLIDEPGLSFSAADGLLTIRLTCQSRDEGGRILTKTAATAVRLWNTGG